jgi:mannose-6-phosphate isomerase-like protein (cupin superfamily)
VQVKLKPRSIKDLESTHQCTQVFVVLMAQPRALQVDIGQHSYLLSPGDHFFVPQNADYRLINHSHDTEAQVAFVVIKQKPIEQPASASGGSASGAGGR